MSPHTTTSHRRTIAILLLLLAALGALGILAIGPAADLWPTTTATPLDAPALRPADVARARRDVPRRAEADDGPEIHGMAVTPRAGALARLLPTRRAGWRLELLSADPIRGRYVVLATRRDGRRSTRARVRRMLSRLASALGDDPRGYEVVVPMSVLLGAHQMPRGDRGNR